MISSKGQFETQNFQVLINIVDRIYKYFELRMIFKIYNKFNKNIL